MAPLPSDEDDLRREIGQLRNDLRWTRDLFREGLQCLAQVKRENNIIGTLMFAFVVFAGVRIFDDIRSVLEFIRSVWAAGW